MEQSTIIKLRQTEASSIVTNGSFATTLQNKVLLEEGDVVKLHSAFLDTTTESNITIDEPIDVSFSCIKYLDAVKENLPFAYTLDPDNHAGKTIGHKHIACARKATGGLDAYMLESVRMTPLHYGPGRSYGDGWIYYIYLSPIPGEGFVRGQTFMPKEYTTEHGKSGVSIPINRLVGDDNPANFQLLTPGVGVPPQPSNTGGVGNGAATINPTAISADDIANPIEETFSFQLGSGVYTPAEIAQIVTDKCSDLQSGGVTGYIGNYPQPPQAQAPTDVWVWPINSAFCTSLSQLYNKVQPVTAASINTDIIFARENQLASFTEIGGAGSQVGQQAPIITPTAIPKTSADDILIGTNNFSLNYDTNLNKLNFDLIHTPYQFSVGNVWTPGITYPDGAEVDKQPTRSYSGIAFTKLNPPDFWQTLGFTETPISVTYDARPLEQTDRKLVLMPNIILTPGVNITQQYAGIDLVWNKIAADASTIPFYSFSSGNFETQITTPIISDRGFNDVINDEGYYFLEVGIKLPQTLIGGSGGGGTDTMSNRVQAIVGKFYTSGNFLQVGSDSAILYQHIGEPQLLADLNVRILHADMTPPDSMEIGPKNSIFLEVIKTIPQPAAPVPNQKQ